MNSIIELRFKLIKETPCGYWIRNERFYGDKHKKWMSKNSHKQFACLTQEDAMISFQARKKRQIKILTAQLNSAKQSLKNSKTYEFKKESEYFI